MSWVPQNMECFCSEALQLLTVLVLEEPRDPGSLPTPVPQRLGRQLLSHAGEEAVAVFICLSIPLPGLC